jgi:NADP-dependent 3-hydroxy acid dehydrogenase YdfG
MLLSGKVAVIFGGSGAIGNAVAQAMTREGAHVYLGARRQEKLDWAASIIRTAGGTVDTFITDVLDEHDASKQITQLAQQTGGIDVVVNATGFMHEQGKRIDALSLSEFMSGITPFLAAQFNIAKAVTPHMGGNRAGVILTIVAPAAPMAMPGHLGHIVGVRSHAIVDAVAAGSYTGEIFTAKAQSMGLTVDQWLGGRRKVLCSRACLRLHKSLRLQPFSLQTMPAP